MSHCLKEVSLECVNVSEIPKAVKDVIDVINEFIKNPTQSTVYDFDEFNPDD